MITISSVVVATSNGNISNPLLLNTLNDAIASGQSAKAIITPFNVGFGGANMPVNQASDLTFDIINSPTENLIKTYDITLTAVSLGADAGGLR